MASTLDNSFDADIGVALAPPLPCAPASCVKVLHLINGDLYAGAERVQDLLALTLGQCGYEVSFACLKPGRFATERRCQHAPLTNVEMRSRFDFSASSRVAALIRQGGYQILHTHTPRTALIGHMAAAWADVPMVHHLHSPAAADTEKFWRNKLNAAVERYSVRRAGALIAVSNSIAEYALRAGLPADRTVVVHYGVPLQGPPVERPAPKSQWTLGVAALWRPRKGLEVMIDALADLRQRGLPVRLRIVGGFDDAAYEQQIRAQVARLQLDDRVDWVGYSRDVIGEMRKMDLFVLPSLYGEGLPMVVLEAMSAAVPVIGTRVEGVPEAVRHGIDGLIVTPGDAQDLARAIERIASGQLDWSALRNSVHRRQQQHFCDHSMAAGVAEVYGSLLK
jgi:glycosyltransferase involved in cell wall biosynthesis